MGSLLVKPFTSILQHVFVSHAGHVPWRHQIPAGRSQVVVLLATEMDKKNWIQLYGNTKPQRMVLELVLQKCQTEHQGLQALLNELVLAADWGKENANLSNVPANRPWSILLVSQLLKLCATLYVFCASFSSTCIYASNSYWDGSSTVENTIALAITPFIS